MTDDSEYGPRLSDEDYEAQVVDLYSTLPERPTRAEAESVRRREMDLTIDNRLGSGFPRERRERLWEISQQLERRRLRIAVGYLMTRLLPGAGRWIAKRLAADVIEEYGRVLGEEELEQFFGQDSARSPHLPPEPFGGR